MIFVPFTACGGAGYVFAPSVLLLFTYKFYGYHLMTDSLDEFPENIGSVYFKA